MRGAAAGASVLVLAAAVAACGEQSRVEPDATINVVGVAREPGGGPLADRPVRLGAGITDSEGALAVLTLGLSCATGECTGDVFDTTTTGDGTYEFSLRGADTQSSFGEAVSELVSVSAAPAAGQVSGAAASARFRIQAEQVALPPLDLVDPGLSVEGGADVSARWSTAAAGPYVLTFEAAEIVPVWQVTTGDQAAVVDPRVLEDTVGRVVVGGGRDDAAEGTTVEIRWRSPGIGYASGAGSPPSRGRPCRYHDAAGATIGSTDGCPVTDGDLAATAPPVVDCPAPGATADPGGCGVPAAVVVDLGAAVPAELVVVRGCSGTCPIETSADGVTFEPVASATSDFAAVNLGGRAVAAIRLGLGAPSLGLREVSVWGPRPADPALRPFEGATAERLGDQLAGGDDGDDGDRTLAFVAAAVLAGVVLATAGFVLGRRQLPMRRPNP